MRINKLFFIGLFISLILGASLVSAGVNLQAKFTSLQKEEARLLGINKTLKKKIVEIKEEISKKKKGIVAGLVVGGVGGVAGAGGMLYSRNKNIQTRSLKKEIADLKEIPKLVDEIMILAIKLCNCGELDSCTLITSKGKFVAEKKDLLQKDVIQLTVIKSDLQRQKSEMDEFFKLVQELVDLEAELGDHDYDKLTEEQKKWKDCDGTEPDGWNLPVVKEKLNKLKDKKDLKSFFDDVDVLYKAVLDKAIDEDKLSKKTYSKEKVEKQKPERTDTTISLETKKEFLEKATEFYENYDDNANTKIIQVDNEYVKLESLFNAYKSSDGWGTPPNLVLNGFVIDKTEMKKEAKTKLENNGTIDETKIGKSIKWYEDIGQNQTTEAQTIINWIELARNKLYLDKAINELKVGSTFPNTVDKDNYKKLNLAKLELVKAKIVELQNDEKTIEENVENAFNELKVLFKPYKDLSIFDKPNELVLNNNVNVDVNVSMKAKAIAFLKNDKTKTIDDTDIGKCKTWYTNLDTQSKKIKKDLINEIEAIDWRTDDNADVKVVLEKMNVNIGVADWRALKQDKLEKIKEHLTIIKSISDKLDSHTGNVVTYTYNGSNNTEAISIINGYLIDVATKLVKLKAINDDTDWSK